MTRDEGWQQRWVDEVPSMTIREMTGVLAGAAATYEDEGNFPGIAAEAGLEVPSPALLMLMRGTVYQRTGVSLWVSVDATETRSAMVMGPGRQYPST